jgi:hypothetical protein
MFMWRATEIVFACHRFAIPGLELIRKVAYAKCDASVLVRWSNYTLRRQPCGRKVLCTYF